MVKNSTGSKIALCYKNDGASHINKGKLYKLQGEYLTFEAEEFGNFQFNSLSVERRLELKIGARVMLSKNHSKGLYVNGTLGHFTSFVDGKIIVTPDEGEPLEEEKEKWSTTERRTYRVKKVDYRIY